tara:strand:+ start:307 stop:525 length:219 start_codon:yes stop_codon:yes gene_type:complete
MWHVCVHACVHVYVQLLQLLRSEALIGHRLQGVLGEAVVDELPLPRRAVLEGARLEDGLRQLAAIAQDAQLP